MSTHCAVSIVFSNDTQRCTLLGLQHTHADRLDTLDHSSGFGVLVDLQLNNAKHASNKDPANASRHQTVCSGIQNRQAKH